MSTRLWAGVVGLALTLGFVQLGCGSRLGPVQASQSAGGIDRPNLPDITIERAKECVAEYGSQLEPQRHEFQSNVELNENGDKNVKIDGIPDTAPDFGACMRNVLRDMPIAEEPFRQGVETLKYRRQEALAEQRRLMGHPVVIVVAGVTIVVSEIVLEASAVTILFAVTVKVVEKAAEDVEEEAWKAVCIAKFVACTAASARKSGNHWGASRCNTCLEACKEEQSWPSDIGNGSCEFWKRNWK